MLAFFLFPLVIASEGERTINNYVVKIHDNRLISVQSTEKSSYTLNLSGLGLRALEKDAFDNLATLKNLNLANNTLSSIPEKVFSKLNNLEHLCLDNNQIFRFKNAFVGLDHLKSLNISNNRLKRLSYSELFGLPKSSIIFTKGLSFSTINTNVFASPIMDPDRYEDDYDEETDKKEEKNVEPEETEDGYEEIVNPYITRAVKVCIQDDVLKMVEPMKNNETLSSDCRRVETIKNGDALLLNNLGISKFEKAWCQLENTTIEWLSFVGNEIIQITREMLNDLPENIRTVNLAGNKIERLEKGIIDNYNILRMNLSSNRIREIEQDALSKTTLFELYVNDNLLKDTMFTIRLPTKLTLIQLQRNEIAEISPGSFSNSPRLQYIFLNNNLIKELKTDSLQGVPSLWYLKLSSNRISNIEPGFFQQSPRLRTLDLSNNSIVSIQKGVFDDIPNLYNLYLSYNKLVNIKKNIPNLPAYLGRLELDFNEIEKLERGTFVHSPAGHLSLKGNKISRIEQGSFDLPSLITLNLSNNTLAELDLDSFQGLNYVISLSLNANRVTRIPKGFTKIFGNLKVLGLDYNPIKRLENGTLPGLKNSEYNFIYLNQVPVEVVEGGLFDDL